MSGLGLFTRPVGVERPGENGAASPACAESSARPLRVLHVLHSLGGGGAERIVCDMARRWRGELVMACACLDGAGALAAEAESLGVEITQLHRRAGVDCKLPARLIALVKKFRPDVIHAHQYTPYLYAALAATFSGHHRIIFTEHGRHYPDVVSLRRRCFNQLLRLRRDRLTAVCRFVAEALRSREGLGPRVEIIPNGVRCERYTPAAIASASSAEFAGVERLPARLLGFDPADPVCIQVARLHPVKDHATSLRAFSELVQQVSRARLVIVGDGPLRGALEDQARDAGLLSKNIFFMGERSDVPALLAGSDLALLSSLSEGACLALLEAMSASLAVVATDVGGNGEIVIHGRTGLLSPRGDARAMAAALEALLVDPERRRAMGRAGRLLAQRRYDQRLMHQRFLALYRRTAGRQP